MKFPNAAKGVKKIFNAEIIALIAALGTGIGLIMSLIGSSKEAAQANAESLLVTAGAILIISGIIVLIAGIMNIIGNQNYNAGDNSFDCRNYERYRLSSGSER